MKTIIEDHEEVRKFVERETGGFVEKIEAESKSTYKPTLNSMEEAFFGKRISYTIKPEAVFLPLRYEALYNVMVVLPPGTDRIELAVCRSSEGLLHAVRKITHRGVEYCL